MREKGELLNGEKINGPFSMVAGAVANPNLKPVDLSIIRLTQKVEAGAAFIQTHAVFNVDGFEHWFDTITQAGIADKTAIIAGVFPLDSAEEAEFLAKKYRSSKYPPVSWND